MKFKIWINRETDKTSLPSRGAWIEIAPELTRKPKTASLPSRGAWIEILQVGEPVRYEKVAPLTGSVD